MNQSREAYGVTTLAYRPPVDIISTDGRLLTRGLFELEFSDEYAGRNGYYDPNDPADVHVLTLNVYALEPESDEGRIWIPNGSVVTHVPATALGRTIRPLLIAAANNLEAAGLSPLRVSATNLPDLLPIRNLPLIPPLPARPICEVCKRPVPVERDAALADAPNTTCSARCSRRLKHRRQDQHRIERGLDRNRPPREYSRRRELLGRYMWSRYRNPHAGAYSVLFPELSKTVVLASHRIKLELDIPSVPRPLRPRAAYLLGHYIAEISRRDKIFDRWLRDYIDRKTANAKTTWIRELRALWSLPAPPDPPVNGTSQRRKEGE